MERSRMKWRPPDNTCTDVIAGTVNKCLKLKKRRKNEDKKQTVHDGILLLSGGKALVLR
jgi:hypothetical protein